MIRKFLFLFAFISIISSAFSATNITSLPYTISTPGDYYLNQSLSSTGHGVTFTTSNASLNCLWYNMTGDGGTSDSGIYIIAEAYDNNNISNCNINNFGYGIYNAQGDFNRFENLNINITRNFAKISGTSTESYLNNIIFNKDSDLDSLTVPIYLINVSDGNGHYSMSFNSTAVNIDGWTNISSIYLYNADNSSIKNLNVDGINDDGMFIYTYFTDNSNFTNLNISNHYIGLYLYSSYNNRFENINITSTAQQGIYGQAASGNFTNIITNNTNYHGIFIWVVTGNLSFNNIQTINSTQGSGLYLQSITGTILINNVTSYNNYESGLYFTSVTGVNVSNTTIYDNVNDIYISNTIMPKFENVTDNYGKYHIYSNRSIIIDGWTNISSIYLNNADNSTIKNLNYDGLNDKSTFLFLDSTDNITLSNVSISNYDYGISLTNSKNNSFDNFTLFGNGRDGLYLPGASNQNNFFTNFNTINNSRYGIYINSINNNFINFTSNNNAQHGVYFTGGSNNTLNNLTLQKNTQYGIALSSSSNYNNISNLYSYNNTQHGITISGSNFNNFNNFTCYANNYGISISTSSYNTFNNFTCFNNIYGIRIESFSNNNNLSNFYIYNNTQQGIFISGSNNSCSNFLSYNNSRQGIYLSNGINTTISNFSIYNNSYQGIHVFSNSQNNTIFNGTSINNTLQNVYFEEAGASDPLGNIFYNNHLGNASKIGSNNWANINYFNYTLPSGLVIGNFWNNLTCLNSIVNGTYEICINPANYTINTSHIDYAPLVAPVISVSYVTGPNGNYYSESIYIEVNASKSISSCTLYFNSTPYVMSVNNNTCYTTASGTFDNSYTYNVSVVGLNTATAMTTTNTINLLDTSVNYASPPTPLNNVKKYALENLTIIISDNGASLTNCIVQINSVNYSMTYSGGNCSYTYTIPVFNRSTNIVFQGFYNVTGTVTALEARTVTIYESQSNQNKIPAFGLTSIILFILTIFGGILFN